MEIAVSLRFPVEWMDLPIYRELRVWGSRTQKICLWPMAANILDRLPSIGNQVTRLTLWNGADGVRRGEGSSALCQDPPQVYLLHVLRSFSCSGGQRPIRGARPIFSRARGSSGRGHMTLRQWGAPGSRRSQISPDIQWVTGAMATWPSHLHAYSLSF